MGGTHERQQRRWQKLKSIVHKELKKKQRRVRGHASEEFGVRTHRAISWIRCAEKQAADLDLQFLCLWIAFNSAYARELDFERRRSEKSQVDKFFERLCQLDKEHRIYNTIWRKYPGPLRTLIRNRYVYKEFWDYKEGKIAKEQWKARFKVSRRNFNRAFERQDTERVLTLLFSKLYVLRNQLIHGASTHGSGINRQQIRDGANILSFLVPTFVDIVLENPEEDWGKTSYPVVP